MILLAPCIIDFIGPNGLRVFLQFIEESKKQYSRILKIMNLLLVFLGVLCIVYCVCVLCSGAGHVIANM
jgi:hypothetical protein